MNYQNMGTFDGGVVGGVRTGGAARGGVLTLDEAAIASGGAFLRSELEKRDPLIRTPSPALPIPGTSMSAWAAAGWMPSPLRP